MRTFKTRAGSVAVKFDNETYFLGTGGSYISDRIILPGQPNPLDNNDWNIYPDLGWSLNGYEASISEDKTVITVKHPQYGNLNFKQDRSCFFSPDANQISVERTPHCFATFYDFTKTHSNKIDSSKTIY